MNLEQVGWNSFFEQQIEAYQQFGWIPARISSEQKKLYQIYSDAGESLAELSGKMLYTAESRSDFPVVGDWVVIAPQPEGSPAIIHALLSRKTSFSRKAAGNVTEEQVIAANMDTVFIVSGLDRDFNLRRIERYLTLVYNSGANPVIVLNKADLCEDVNFCISKVESIACGIAVHPISAREHDGIETLRSYTSEGSTVALLGSSGVGKSTLINALLGYERQQVDTISTHVNKGRHTTTHRELIVLETGGLLMDNPGMRELQLWGDESDLHGAFEEIEELALQCRFSDCGHDSEPGCAVKSALENGQLDRGRFQSYLKLQKEFEYLEQRQECSADYLEKKKWQQIAQFQKTLYQEKR
ncbi:MAG: ribosome small subunit-dependent GTPase A [bacterium]|nr:ribosome small subunit-dependent GTPase A [bacterium]